MDLKDENQGEIKALLSLRLLNQIQIAGEVGVAQGILSKIAKRPREDRNVTVERVGNCSRKSRLSETTKLRLCIDSKVS